MKHGTAVAKCISVILIIFGVLAGLATINGWRTSNDLLVGPIWSASIFAIAAKVWTRRKPEMGFAIWHAISLLLFLFPAAGALLKWSWFPEPWPDLTVGVIAAFIVIIDGVGNQHMGSATASAQTVHQQAPESRREGNPAVSEPTGDLSPEQRQAADQIMIKVGLVMVAGSSLWGVLAKSLKRGNYR